LVGATNLEREECFDALAQALGAGEIVKTRVEIERNKAHNIQIESLQRTFKLFHQLRAEGKSGAVEHTGYVVIPIIREDIEAFSKIASSPEILAQERLEFARILSRWGTAIRENRPPSWSEVITREIVSELLEIAQRCEDYEDIYNEILSWHATSIAEPDYLHACQYIPTLLHQTPVVAGTQGPGKLQHITESCRQLCDRSLRSFISARGYLTNLETHERVGLQVHLERPIAIIFGLMGDDIRLESQEHRIGKLRDNSMITSDRAFALDNGLTTGRILMGLPNVDKELDRMENSVANETDLLALRSIQYRISRMLWVLRYDPQEKRELEKLGNEVKTKVEELDGYFRYADTANALMDVGLNPSSPPPPPPSDSGLAA
jgi:hypothetical protein